jgi:hypothetical protein
MVWKYWTSWGYCGLECLQRRDPVWPSNNFYVSKGFNVIIFRKVSWALNTQPAECSMIPACCLLVASIGNVWTLKMEAVCSYRSSVSTPCRFIPLKILPFTLMPLNKSFILSTMACLCKHRWQHEARRWINGRPIMDMLGSHVRRSEIFHWSTSVAEYQRIPF